MGFKVGVTTGLYMVAHADELASTLKKIGFALTRGTSVIEISGDTPHEITETEGKDCRDLASKQGIELLFHGSLTTPLDMPERSEWRDAHDHMMKSARSAIHAGCKYVLFHACLNYWVEMMTYAGSKMEITLCDHVGRFISELLYENEKLRNWFLENMRSMSDIDYTRMILTDEDESRAYTSSHLEAEDWSEKEKASRMKKEGFDGPPKSEEEERRRAEAYKRIAKEVAKEAGVKQAELRKQYTAEFVKQKITEKDEKKRMWRIPNHARLSDGYRIIAHYMFLSKDPIWTKMCEVYGDVLEKYKIDYSDKDWLDKAWEKAENGNDREFKSFYYAAIGAKYLEGHIRRLLEWIDDELVKKEYKNKPELAEIAKKLNITIEIPDARDPRYGGLYILWHPKQIYAAVKTMREKSIKTDRVWMTMDFEHMASQGTDPTMEMATVIKNIPDIGNYVLSVHANYPSTLHAHYPLEIGDTVLYRLLLFCRKAGMGKKNDVFLIYERGGGQDPFQRSVDALRLVAKYLEKDCEVENLPLDFFGLQNAAGDVIRQSQIIRDHRFDPLKDLFVIPEEEWGTLSSAAKSRGRTEIFKKEELR